MRPTALRRATAALATTSLAFAALMTGLVAPASAAGAGFVVDDFGGTSMGPRVLVPGNNTCTPTGNTSLTPGPGTLEVDVRVPDSLGCTYANAQLIWTASGTVDLEAGGADRIELRYRDVAPNQPSAVTFGLQVTDVNGRVAHVGGLTRNGGAASDWLTVRYAPAYVGDVAVLSFPSNFDRGQVKSIALLIAATRAGQGVSVTLEGVAAGDGEPTYQVPAFGSTAPLVFPASTSTTRTVTVTGNPAPDVTVTSGKPSWMTVSTSKAGTTTTVSLSGNPGTSYAETSLTLHADVAGSLTADATIPVVVPSPVTVGYGTANPTLGVAGPTTLGTVTSTPASRILGPTAGLPPGTELELVGSDVRLTGAPTAAGTYTVATTIGNDYRSAAFSRQVVVGQSPAVAAIDDQDVVLGEPLSIPVTVGGHPAPAVQVDGLPEGLSYADGAIAGTPTATAERVVSLTATNAWGSSTTSFRMSVGPRPTVVAPTTTVVTAGESVSLPVLVTGDPGEVLATGLPAGLRVDASGATVVITGTPTRPTSAAGASGTATISARNTFATATTSWSWTLQAAPQLSGPATVSTTVGSALVGAQVVVTGHPSPEVSVHGAVSLPDGLSVDLTTPGTVAVVGTPTTSGTAVLELTADNAVGDPVVRTLTVSAIAAPAFPDPEPRLTVAAGSSDDLVLDRDGHPRPALSLGSALPSWLTFSAADGTFTASPAADVSGVFGPYTVTATNPAGSAVADVTVEVTAPPTVLRRHVGHSGAINSPTGTWPVATYGGFPAPTVTVTGLPAGLTATTTGGEVTVSGTPTESGAFPVTITATNAHGSDSATVTVEITAPPALSAPPTVSIRKGVAAVLPVTVGGHPRPTLVAGGLPAGLELDGSAGTISGTPAAAGDYDVQLSLSRDGTPVVGSALTMTVHVTAAPTFVTPPTGTTVRLGSAADVAAFTVAGHPTPTVTAEGLPAGLTLSRTGAVVRLVGTPTVPGTFDVEVELDSTAGTRTARWKVVVGEPAGVTAPDRVVVDVDEAIAPIGVVTTGHPTPTVTAAGLPDGLELESDGSGTRVVGTPTQGGRHSVTLTARNGVGTPATATVTLVVTEAPEVAERDGTTTVPAGATVDVALTSVTGYPDPTLATTGLPAGLDASLVGGELRLTGTTTAVGSYAVELTLANGSGADLAVPWTVVVQPEDVVVSLAAERARPGEAADVHVSGLQPGETVEIWLHSTPRLLATTAADASGEVRLTVTVPEGTPAGSHTVVVRTASGVVGTVPLQVLPAVTPSPEPSPSATHGTGSHLATTGSEVGGLVAVALLAMAAGAGLLVVRRRHA